MNPNDPNQYNQFSYYGQSPGNPGPPHPSSSINPMHVMYGGSPMGASPLGYPNPGVHSHSLGHGHSQMHMHRQDNSHMHSLVSSHGHGQETDQDQESSYGLALQHRPTHHQMIPQPFPVPQTQPFMSPAAIARQQRVSADSKRGKRRRATNEAQSSRQGDSDSNHGLSISEGGNPAMAGQGHVLMPIMKLKEERRKKRLLRNRVSAQQARERKRQQMTELEEKCAKLEDSNNALESQIETLSRENEELRLLVRSNMHTQPHESIQESTEASLEPSLEMRLGPGDKEGPTPEESA